MAHLLPFRPSAALFLGVALLLSGCCANNVCDCQDEQADALELRFGAGFSAAELDTIVVLRSPLPYKPTTKMETVTLVRAPAQAQTALVLNNGTPFAQVGTAKVNAYRYEIQYLAKLPTGRSVPATVLVIDSTRLRGSLQGDGCCTCYANAEKVVYATRAKKNRSALDSVLVVDLKQTPYLELTK